MSKKKEYSKILSDLPRGVLRVVTIIDVVFCTLFDGLSVRAVA